MTRLRLKLMLAMHGDATLAQAETQTHWRRA